MSPPEWHAEAKRLRAEVEFLTERLARPDPSWVGRSSNAMVAQALAGSRHPAEWPMDKDDLARCEETYRRAPTHLQREMFITLLRFRAHVRVGGLHCEGCDTSGHTFLREKLCRACSGERA